MSENTDTLRRFAKEVDNSLFWQYESVIVASCLEDTGNNNILKGTATFTQRQKVEQTLKEHLKEYTRVLGRKNVNIELTVNTNSNNKIKLGGIFILKFADKSNAGHTYTATYYVVPVKMNSHDYRNVITSKHDKFYLANYAKTKAFKILEASTVGVMDEYCDVRKYRYSETALETQMTPPKYRNTPNVTGNYIVELENKGLYVFEDDLIDNVIYDTINIAFPRIGYKDSEIETAKANKQRPSFEVDYRNFESGCDVFIHLNKEDYFGFYGIPSEVYNDVWVRIRKVTPAEARNARLLPNYVKTIAGSTKKKRKTHNTYHEDVLTNEYFNK